ncbi:MAG TPA: hypothetical protein VK446_10405 [Methylocystis sp.]|nr:hypothetical protein [Methylocystis sp.]
MSAVLQLDDVAQLRRAIYSKKFASREDLAALLRRDDASAAFARLLADIAVDVLVDQADPEKYVSQADADWFVAELGRSPAPYEAKIAALLDLLRYAASAPRSLETYCVGEIEKAVTKKGVVAPEDTQALREAVFSSVEGSALHVTRDSAEALFNIAHATDGAPNDPAFPDFFAKAVGNYLMGIAFRWTPSAAAEREKQKQLDAKPANFGAFLLQMFSGFGRATPQSLDEMDEGRVKAENDADAAEMALASEIDAGETEWLLAHLSREGALTDAEKALLVFLRQEAPSLPAPLAARLSEAA